MSEFRMYKIVIVLCTLALVLAACGSSAQNQSIIATAVAQTLEAGAASAEVPVISTNTPEPPLPTLQASLTPAITPTAGPTLVSAPADPDCIYATLISEYPPDGTVYKPNVDFTKTWTIRNDGTCTWDSSYKLIFWSGDIMGGSTYYDLPEIVLPGDDITISIFLKTPLVEGNYTGYWRLQTPWNAVFGVGQYSQAFFTNILVDKRPAQEYGILGVEYEIVRDPAEGCPLHVTYTINATITTNGEYDFQYYWEQKDFNNTAPKTMIFDAAGSKTISRSWIVSRGDAQNDRWMRIVVIYPEQIYFSKAVFPNNCP